MLRLLICAAFFHFKKKYINWHFLCLMEAKGVDPFEVLGHTFKLPWKPTFRSCVITPEKMEISVDFTCPKCNFTDIYTFDLEKRETLECGSCHEKFTR